MLVDKGLHKIPDVQAGRPLIPMPITWVSLKDVKIPSVDFVVDGMKLTLVPVVEASVNLPANQRGIHASRTYEAIITAVNQANRTGIKLEELAGVIAEELIRKHHYSTKSRVRIKSEAYFRERAPVTSAVSYEVFQIILEATASKLDDDIDVKRFLGARVTGLTACPCAKEMVREIYRSVSNGGIAEDAPLATHMQRSYGTILVEAIDNMKVMDLVSIMRGSLSAGTVELLKREDEARIVLNALEKTRFVEDAAREAAAKLLQQYPTMPDSNRIFIKVEALESIHNHNLVAVIRASAGEIRNQMTRGLEA